MAGKDGNCAELMARRTADEEEIDRENAPLFDYIVRTLHIVVGPLSVLGTAHDI